ncbi:sulfite exporter TauE/SafE family protein [Pedobacter jeongneungensis]|uniref:sulfite exporter TauE/SafE family protein n=1 Tax=Pedobacter jeongneungensis TaxID=947309 RepID=UPI0004693701|nr:sulfite exporter TauE/SafE family protein [Pedobacter jeongneungensis]
MEILGYLSSVLIGISLGLLGAGGSILTVPILVYLFGLSPAISVRYSLWIVGFTSLFALIPRVRKGEVLLLEGGVFGVISISVVCIVRVLILPLVPHELYKKGDFVLTLDNASMISFAILMFFVSRAMTRQSDARPDTPVTKASDLLLVSSAIATGLLTGFLGAGGGFLIVPVLMFFFRLDAKKAIGTSLFIITLNSISGFLSEMNLQKLDWTFIGCLTILSVFGSIIGRLIGQRLDTIHLRKAFGWFIFILAVTLLTIQGIQLIYT